MENMTNLNTSSSENLDRNLTNEGSQYLKNINTVSVVFCSLVSVLGTVGNGLVIFITGFRMKKTVHTIWILNLAIADFCFCFFLPFYIVQVSWDFHWPFGPVMCKADEAIAFLNLFASVYFLMVISIDRCVSVQCPVWAQNHRTPRLAFFVVLGVWILALILTFPGIYFRDSHKDPKTNITMCSYEEVFMDRLFILQFISGFIIPFCVIAVCYGAIVVRLKRDLLSQSSRPFKVITAVIVAFLVCWFPFHLFSLLSLKLSHNFKVVALNGLTLSTSLAYFNSCLNPILYFCMGHNFKRKLRFSVLSALANAFTEDNNPDNTKTSNCSAELNSLNL